MRRLVLLSILSFALTFALLGCSQRKNEEEVSGPIRAQIPFSLDGNYALKIVDILSLENLITLQGQAVEFMIDPDTLAGRLKGRLPEFRYIKDDQGVVVPKDILSLQLMTVYAHFEKMRELDLKLGIANQLVWPAKIAVNAKYQSKDGPLVNNALYSSEYDALLLVPFVGDDMPIMINAGVLAHEHFHHIFQKMVSNKLGSGLAKKIIAHAHEEKKMVENFQLGKINEGEQEPQVEEDMTEEEEHQVVVRELYHEVLLRGLNEGFADVWGWVYSGDLSFVGRSLPKEKSRRDLNVQVSQIISKQEIKATIEHSSDARLPDFAYTIGTQFARAVRTYAQLMAQSRGLSPSESQLEIGALILRILPEITKKYNGLEKTAYLEPQDIVEMLMTEAQKMTASECFYLTGLLQAEERKIAGQTRCEEIERKEKETLQ